MPYIWIAPLFSIFFIWAYLLESIAHFLIREPHDNHGPIPTSILTFDMFAYQNISQLFLRIVCTLCFCLAAINCLPKNPIFFLFISALWITVYTDLEKMLISRLVSIYLIPVGILASLLGFLPITPTESIIASILAAGFLLTTNKIFYLIKGHDGLGQGDIELLAFIGAWIGFLGTWCTIVIGSIVGTIIGSIYLLWTRQQIRILPFGPFLALGAIMFLLYWNQLAHFFQVGL